MRFQPYLAVPNPIHTLFLLLNTIRPQLYLAVPNPRHTLFLLFEHYKAPAIPSRTLALPYFSIFNNKDGSRTLF